MLIPFRLYLHGSLFFGRASSAYPLLCGRGRNRFEIYLFQHKSKNNLRKKTQRLRDLRGGEDIFRNPTISASGASQTPLGSEFSDWLLMTSSLGPAPSPPSPTMSSVLKHLSDVMQGGTQVAPFFLPLPSSLLSSCFFSPSPSFNHTLSAHQLHASR